MQSPRRSVLQTIGAALRLQLAAAPVAAAVLLVLALAGGSVAALVGWLTQQLFDELARGAAIDAHRATMFAIATALSGGSAIVVFQLGAYLELAARAKVTLRVERSLMTKVVALAGLRHFEDPSFLARLRLAEEAAHEAPQELTSLATSLFRAVVSVVTLTAVVAAVAPAIAGLLLVVGAVGLGAQLVRNRWSAQVSEALVHTHRWRDFYRALLIDVRAAKEIRLFGLGELLLGRLTRASGKAAAGELCVAGRGVAIQAALAATTAIVTAGSTWVIVGRVIEGRATLGAVSLFLAAVAGIQNAFGGVVFQLGAAGRNALTFRNYLEVMELPTTPPGQLPDAPALRRGIEIRDAWFRYTPDGPWVLRGVDLWIPAGETVGVVGLNGAGKTTLIKLLCRFYDLERGQILWDGADVRGLDTASLHRRMSATFQDFMTYEFSAAENIGLGNAATLDDHDRIRAAARLADIDEQLAALPNGFATTLSRTLVAEDGAAEAAGTTLSVGQWQRVALARSLTRPDADLLLLDEPSSGLDAEAEHRVHRTLARHGAGRTRLLISHRLGSLRGADRIAVLGQGRICELGTHDELIARGGAYARLFSLQAAGYHDRHVHPEAACS